jgi:DNA (cytosine-5)-methyltransferase 1
MAGGRVTAEVFADPSSDRRPRLLDVCCGAGGASMGYRLAGFDVVGVDKDLQPNYPFEFIRADALEVLADQTFVSEFDVLAGSPPCQMFTAYRRRPGVGDGYLNLIPDVRRAFVASGKPYVIENVETARSELHNPVRLCGSSFGLDVRRHRLFESNMPLSVPPCDHSWQTPRFPPATNRRNLRRTVEVGVYRIQLPVQQKAMGIDWMRLSELSQAIPPAYTEHLGLQIVSALDMEAAA